MKCTECGKELPEDAVSCPFCGAEVRWVPEYNSPDMIRVMLHNRKEDAKKRAEQLEAARKARLARAKSPGRRLIRFLAIAILAGVLALTANGFINNNTFSNYGYLKTMAERALDEKDWEKAERYAEAASRLREDSTELDALFDRIDNGAAAGGSSSK